MTVARVRRRDSSIAIYCPNCGESYVLSRETPDQGVPLGDYCAVCAHELPPVIEEPPLPCPACATRRKQSDVHGGGSTKTMLSWRPYQDAEGRHHNHDPNATTTANRCSEGHHWWATTYDACWCGWQTDRAPEITVETPQRPN